MRVIALAIVWTAIAFVPTAAAASPLAGTTTIESAAPAYTDVSVPVALHFFGDQATRPKVTVASTGSAVILAIRRLGPADPYGRDYVEFDRFGPPDKRITGSTASFTCPCDEQNLALKPGAYRLYLLADAAAKITLVIPELKGELTLRPYVPVPFDVGPLNPITALAPFTTVLGRWGAQARSGGTMNMVAWFDGASSASIDHLEVCFLDSTREAEGDSAFQPGCSRGVSTADVQPLGDGRWSLWATYVNFPAGRYGQGANLTHVAETVTGGGVATWAGYDDDAPPLDDAPLPPAQTHPPAATTRPRVRGRLALVSNRLRVVRGRASVRLRCSAAGPCSGVVSLLTTRRKSEIVLPASHSGTVRIPLSLAQRRALRGNRRVRAALLLRNRTATGIQESRLRVVLTR